MLNLYSKMVILSSCRLPYSFLLFSLLYTMIWFGSQVVNSQGNNETSSSSSSSYVDKAVVHVGVVLDMNSSVGAMADVSMNMSLLDFYDMHPNYTTKLILHTRNDAGDVVGAASAVVDLLKNVGVHTIIGPQRTNQVMFVIELGRKAHVPIISFSATSPFISPDQSPYFIRAAQNDSSQVKAITAMIQGFSWHEIVVIYEDTEYGNGIIPHLTDAFLEVGVQVPCKKAIPTSAVDFQILRELKKIKAMRTRVILVHMDTSLGSRLFKLANKAGMMSEGYAWLITDGLSNSLDEMDPMVIDSMEGVLGLRPYVPTSKNLESFKFRWKRMFPSMKPNCTPTDLNIFGLWAYDTVWALAMAVERIGPVESRFIEAKDGKSETDIENLGISEIGPKLLVEMLNTKLKGLSGEFQLVSGHLQPSALEILNVVGKGERIIGYWTPDKGISRSLGSSSKASYSTSINKLKKIIWPGDSAEKPVGQVPLNIKKKLLVGIPVKKGFNEFVKIGNNSDTNKIEYNGFSIDMFRMALAKLKPVPECHFIPVPTNGKETTESYDDLLYGVYNKTFDVVAGDTTIAAHRWFVDFTLPYSDSGISMVVPARQERSKNLWIFIQPFSLDLWLTIIAASIVTGIVVSILERQSSPTLRSSPLKHIDMILMLPLSSLYYSERNVVVENRSRIVLVIWYFLMVILIQSYTASFSSILTVQSLSPKVTDLKQYFVGYQEGSFVREYLINKLNFQATMLKPYSTVEEYHDALSRGSNNGGVAAIFDETPYIRLFLGTYCSKYMIDGPTYKTDGFGFAFPISSPFVSLVSKAVLNVTQSGEYDELEQKYFNGKSCQDDAATIASKSHSLKAYSFAGLLIVTFGGIFVITAFLTLFQAVSESSQWGKLVATAKDCFQKDNSPQPSDRIEAGDNLTTTEMDNIGDVVPEIDDSVHLSRTSSHSGRIAINEGEEEEEERHSL